MELLSDTVAFAACSADALFRFKPCEINTPGFYMSEFYIWKFSMWEFSIWEFCMWEFSIYEFWLCEFWVCLSGVFFLEWWVALSRVCLKKPVIVLCLEGKPCRVGVFSLSEEA